MIQEHIKHPLEEDKIGKQLSIPYPECAFTGHKERSLMRMSDRMRLLGRGW